MVRVNSKVGDLSTRSTVGCVKKVVCILQPLQSPNSVPFCSLALFIPFPSNHVTAQPIGPWAYGRAGPNRKAHLVPLIAITEPMSSQVGVRVDSGLSLRIWSRDNMAWRCG